MSLKKSASRIFDKKVKTRQVSAVVVFVKSFVPSRIIVYIVESDNNKKFIGLHGCNLRFSSISVTLVLKLKVIGFDLKKVVNII